MNKTALVIHGWPQPIYKSHIVYKYFEEKGYKVFNPYLFSRKFTLDEEGISQELSQVLGENKPNLIVGVSLGGLIIPIIAKKYPRAKLIFVATGPRFKPSSQPFKDFTIFIYKHKNFLRLLNIIKFLPLSLLSIIYKRFNPFSGRSNFMNDYLKDMLKNIKDIKRIPIPEEREMLDFAMSIDNTENLKELKNNSFIIYADGDVLMPPSLSVDLHRLLKQSKLIKVNGGHFNVLTKENLKELDKILNI
jgi:pimeloyl-ACP methyl ester carboxylesterase